MSRINYDLTRIKAVAFDVDGVLSPTTVPLGANGLPNRMVNLKDGYAIELAAEKGIHLAVISGARESGIGKRLAGLGIDDVMMHVSDKRTALLDWMSRKGLKAEEVAFCGDDVPDYDAMLEVGLRVAPLDAAVDIKLIANYISPCNGGYGVARDLLEQILRANNLWPLGPQNQTACR